jgi:enoyl-CoA hydratase/carnithine racemase
MGAVALDHDEHMRPETTMQSLGSLNPSFTMPGEMGFDSVVIQRYPQVEKVDHVHHAGNSSGIVDGAAGVLFGSKEAGEALGLKPRARVRGMASIGSEPSIMLTGPSFVTEKLLKKLGMDVADIDLYELNEAFAAVVLRYQQALDIPFDKLNVNGGAIAMGHPLGATGAMILGTMVDELERSDKETALSPSASGPAWAPPSSSNASEEEQNPMDNFKIDVDADGIALVTFDVPGKSMNTITVQVIAELGEVVERIKTDAAIKGAVIASGKASGFCAGADLDEIGAMTGGLMGKGLDGLSDAELKAAFKAGFGLNAAYRALETCGKPVAAAVEGLALGGGFELTLACHYRVVADNPKIQLGLPESKVGLLPGAGGTQRLTRMIGVMAAAPFLLEGKSMKPAEALGQGRPRGLPARRGDRTRQGLDQDQPQAPSRPGTRRTSRSPAAGPTTRPASRSSSWASPCCASRPTATIRPS